MACSQHLSHTLAADLPVERISIYRSLNELTTCKNAVVVVANVFSEESDWYSLGRASLFLHSARQNSQAWRGNGARLRQEILRKREDTLSTREC